MKYYSIKLPNQKRSIPRAQASLEFAVLAGMFMVLFIIFFYVLTNHIIEFKQQQDARSAQDLLSKVQSEMTLALRVHDGYNRTFWLPLDLRGRNYSIVLNFNPIYTASEVELKYNDQFYIAPVFVNLTSNSRIAKGKNFVQKYDGNITISPAS